MEQTTRELIARIDVGKRTGTEHDGCVLIYRFRDHAGIELVTTERDNGDCSLMLSPEEAQAVGKRILEAAGQQN